MAEDKGEKDAKKVPSFAAAAVPSFVSNFVPNISAAVAPIAPPVVKQEPRQEQPERQHEKIFRGRGRGGGRGRQRRDRARGEQRSRGPKEERPPRPRLEIVSRFDEAGEQLGPDVPVALPLRKPELHKPGENVTDAAVVKRGIEKNSLFFMQLPRLPLISDEAVQKDAKPAKAGVEPAAVHTLPQRHIGKLRVYKSGRVEMKVGDLVYDVTRGSDTACLQQAVVIDPEEGHVVVLGDLTDRLLVSLNVDSLGKQQC